MWEIFFSKNHAENETGGLVPDLLLFFKKALYKVKASGPHLSQQLRTYNKNSVTFETVDQEICPALFFY